MQSICVLTSFNFMHRDCNCNLAGSVSEDCNSNTGMCECKESIQGQNCSQCKDGSFNIQMNNPSGCQPCFCSGLTSECSHAEGFVASTLITEFNSSESDLLSGWTLVPTDTTSTISVDGVVREAALGAGVLIVANTPAYISAPSSYRGNHLNSYGQLLIVSVQSPAEDFQSIFTYDVILSGSGVEVGANFSTVAPPQQRTTLSVQLSAENGVWKNVNTLEIVTPAVLQSILISVEELLVTVAFSTDVTLFSIALDVAAPSDFGGDDALVTWVEECLCPSNYSGLSCESCAVGYTRDESGTCQLCQCNGFSTTCDAITGSCTNCSQLTAGESCERCSSGTYGDPVNGIPCQPCPCPFTEGVGQFSNECMLLDSSDVMCLNCPVGHAGLRCESCSSGFFGDPMGIDGTPTACSDCLCSGNINVSDPDSCDRSTGACRGCLYNTTGRNCELCLPGYYGDPTEAKNCTGESTWTYIPIVDVI